MDKSLDEMMADRGIKEDDAPRRGGGKGGKGGKRGGGPPSSSGDRYRPYGNGKGSSGKGAAKGRAMRRAEPSINERWVHDKYAGAGDKAKRGGLTFNRISTKGDAPEQDAIECKVYLSNIPWGWDARWEEGDIKAVCQTVAPVKKVVLYYDHGGRPNGTGMVTFYSPADAAKAVAELNGATLGEKKQELSVTHAKISSIGSVKRNLGGFGQQQSTRLSKEQMEKLFGTSEPEHKEPAAPSQAFLDDQLTAYLDKKDEEVAEEDSVPHID